MKPDHSKFSLADDLEILMGDICSTIGICLMEDLQPPFDGSGEIDAMDFAIAMVNAEDLSPDQHPEFVRQIRNMFIDRYSSKIVSPETF